MKILSRNFIRLLSSGSFDAKVGIEPMSAFKWKQVLYLANENDVADYICQGIIKASDDKAVNIPTQIVKMAEENAFSESPGKSTSHNEDYKFTQGSIKKFSNFYLNRILNKIIFNEVHSIDTSIESIKFLLKTIDSVNDVLVSGLSLRWIIFLGTYLRKDGDKIDFIKIEKWIKQLKIGKMTNIIGNDMIAILQFEPDEIPFLRKTRKKTYERFCDSLESSIHKVCRNKKTASKRHLINPIYKPNTSPLKYFFSFPLEVSSKMLSNCYKSLSNIEE